MAEVLFLQRGNHRATDDFERFLDGQLFPYERTYYEYQTKLDDKGQVVMDADGKPAVNKIEKKKQFMLQGGRREYKIFGYAIPDPMVNTFLNGMNVGDGQVHPKQAAIAVAALRKMMGAQKIPLEKDRGNKTMAIPRAGVAIYPIGLKEDNESLWIDPETGEPFKQENI